MKMRYGVTEYILQFSSHINWPLLGVLPNLLERFLQTGVSLFGSNDTTTQVGKQSLRTWCDLVLFISILAPALLTYTISRNVASRIILTALVRSTTLEITAGRKILEWLKHAWRPCAEYYLLTYANIDDCRLFYFSPAGREEDQESISLAWSPQLHSR